LHSFLITPFPYGSDAAADRVDRPGNWKSEECAIGLSPAVGQVAPQMAQNPCPGASDIAPFQVLCWPPDFC